MKLIYKVFLLSILVITCIVNMHSQVTKVQYQLRYSAVDTAYEMYLIINEGGANNPVDRTQFNAQISVLVPSGTKLEISEIFMPLQDNYNYNGFKPLKWGPINNVSSPISDPKHDYISIIPLISNATSRYNDLAEGDSVKLFSFKVNPLPSCLSDIRLFENGKDPISSAPGMQGGDFSQAFTIGSIIAKFDKNLAPKGMPGHLDFSIPQDTFLVGDVMTLPNIPQTYWINNYPSVSAMLTANSVKFLAHGFTTLTLQDSLSNKCGTSEPQFITGPVKYNAGPDYVACVGDKINVSGTTPETGLWEPLLTNPTNSFAENIGNAKAIIHVGSLAGVYKYIYGSSLEGFDTMQIVVNQKPAVSLEQNFLCTADVNIHAIANTQGTWVSNSPALALINNEGLIQPMEKGKVNFTFTDKATGCSNTTNDVIIYKTPVANISEDTIQVGGIAVLSPNTGGTWSQTNSNLIATFTSAGLVTAINEGNTSFIFKEYNNNLCPSKPVNLTIVDGKIDIISPVSMCKGNISILYPRPSDAKWSSDDESIVTIDQNGKMTAVNPGTTTIHLSSIQGQGSFTVTVHGLPSISLPLLSLCVNTTANIAPQSSNVIWQSSNSNVIKINNDGLWNAINPGTTLISVIDANGCPSNSVEVKVNDKPYLSQKNLQTCIDNTLDLSSIIGDQKGLWSNNGSGIIDLNGNMVVPKNEGKTSLIFVDAISTCSSDVVSLEIMPKPKVSYASADSVEVGQKIILSPNTSIGTWTDYDPSIAIINANNEVEGIKEGSTSFTFVDAMGCKSEPMIVKVYLNTIISGVSNTEGNVANIFPNPFNDKLTIESNNTFVNARVYNVYGRLLIHTTGNTLQTSDLVSGIYIIEVNTTAGKVVRKLTKE